MNNKTLAIIISAQDKASKVLEETSANTERLSGKMGEAMKKVAKVAAAASVATGAAIAGISMAAVKSTAKLEQSLGGSEVVFAEHSKEIQKLAKDSAKVMGTSQNQYLETANKMGSLFQGAGFDVKKSMDITSSAMQRATDVATAMGISTDMALESIAGAAKGNFTMMDNLGVKMTATSIEAYALSKGFDKAYDSMTETEKVGFAMQQFMETTAKYAGNYAKENETLSGSFQTLKGAWGNFLSGVEGSDKVLVEAGANMAKVLGKQLPIIAKQLVDGISGVWREMKATSPEFRKYATIAEDTFKTIVNGAKATESAIRALAPFLIGGAAAWASYKTAVIAVNTVQKLQALYATATATQYMLLNGTLVTVRGATVAQTIAQIALNNAMKLSPIGLVTAAIIGITAAYMASTSQTDRNEAASTRLKDARNLLKEATDRARDAEKLLADEQLGAEGAALRAEGAQLRYNDALANYGPDSYEARVAAHDLKLAQDDVTRANDRVRDSAKLARDEQAKIAEAKETIKQANAEIAGSAYGVAGGYQTITARVQEAQREMSKAPTRTGVAPSKSLIPSINGSYATGGYTGRGAVNEIAGVVHKGEYVIPKSQVDQSTGKPKVAAGGGQTFNMYGNVQLGDASAVDRYYERFMGMMDKSNSLGEYGVGI